MDSKLEDKPGKPGRPINPPMGSVEVVLPPDPQDVMMQAIDELQRMSKSDRDRVIKAIATFFEVRL